MTDIVDVEYLHVISDNDPEFEAELLQVFITDTAEHIQAARQFFQSQNLLLLSREAHHLKGASSNIGASAIHSLAITLEQVAKEEDPDPIPNLLDQLEASLQEVKRFFIAEYSGAE